MVQVLRQHRGEYAGDIRFKASGALSQPRVRPRDEHALHQPKPVNFGPQWNADRDSSETICTRQAKGAWPHCHAHPRMDAALKVDVRPSKGPPPRVGCPEGFAFRLPPLSKSRQCIRERSAPVVEAQEGPTRLRQLCERISLVVGLALALPPWTVLFLLSCARHVVVPVHKRPLGIVPPCPNVEFEERR
jgi:hypothetical protein